MGSRIRGEKGNLQQHQQWRETGQKHFRFCVNPYPVHYPDLHMLSCGSYPNVGLAIPDMRSAKDTYQSEHGTMHVGDCGTAPCAFMHYFMQREMDLKTVPALKNGRFQPLELTSRMC